MSDDKDKADELPQLTDKQMNFVLGIQKGLSQSDAYRQAYDCDKRNQAGIWADASTLASSQKVSAWLSHLKVQQITQATYTLEAHLKDMNNIKEKALEAGHYSAATTACANLGKATDHYTQHIETTVSHKADLELLDSIEKNLGHNARIEAERRMGYQVKELH